MEINWQVLDAEKTNLKQVNRYPIQRKFKNQLFIELPKLSRQLANNKGVNITSAGFMMGTICSF